MYRPLVIALFAASALLNVRIRWAVLCVGALLCTGLTHLIAVIVSSSKLLASQTSCRCFWSSGLSPNGTLKAMRLWTLERNTTVGPILLHKFLRFSWFDIQVVAASESISTSTPPLWSLLIDLIFPLASPRFPRILLNSVFSWKTSV